MGHGSFFFFRCAFQRKVTNREAMLYTDYLDGQQLVVTVIFVTILYM